MGDSSKPWCRITAIVVLIVVLLLLFSMDDSDTFSVLTSFSQLYSLRNINLKINRTSTSDQMIYGYHSNIAMDNEFSNPTAPTTQEKQSCVRNDIKYYNNSNIRDSISNMSKFFTINTINASNWNDWSKTNNLSQITNIQNLARPHLSTTTSTTECIHNDSNLMNERYFIDCLHRNGIILIFILVVVNHLEPKIYCVIIF